MAFSLTIGFEPDPDEFLEPSLSDHLWNAMAFAVAVATKSSSFPPWHLVRGMR